ALPPGAEPRRAVRRSRLLLTHGPRLGAGARRVQAVRGAGGRRMTISKSIHVKRPVERSFRLFTEEIGRWWPLKEGFSFGGARAAEIFLEGREGGRFFERFSDGEEFQIGVVTTYAPPARIVFTWKATEWDAPTEV